MRGAEFHACACCGKVIWCGPPLPRWPPVWVVHGWSLLLRRAAFHACACMCMNVHMCTLVRKNVLPRVHRVRAHCKEKACKPCSLPGHLKVPGSRTRVHWGHMHTQYYYNAVTPILVQHTIAHTPCSLLCQVPRWLQDKVEITGVHWVVISHTQHSNSLLRTLQSALLGPSMVPG